MIHIDEEEVYNRLGVLNQVQFPEATFVDFLHKAADELKEVELAPKSKRLLEFADVLICVLASAKKDGWTYQELICAITTKTMINSVRKFVRLEDGTYQHVEGA
jgi:hypothetical protein